MDPIDLEPHPVTEEELEALLVDARDERERQAILELRSYRRLVPLLLNWSATRFQDAISGAAPFAVLVNLLRQRPPIAFIAREVITIEDRAAVVHIRLEDLSSTERYRVHCITPDRSHIETTATIIAVAKKGDRLSLKDVSRAFLLATVRPKDMAIGTLVYTDGIASGRRSCSAQHLPEVRGRGLPNRALQLTIGVGRRASPASLSRLQLNAGTLGRART